MEEISDSIGWRILAEQSMQDFWNDGLFEDRDHRYFKLINRANNFDDVISDKSDEIDNAYATFFCKALVLKGEIEKELKKEITPRHLDNFLITLDNNKSRGKNI